MLKKAFIFSCICISIFIFLFFINLFIITEKDLKNFQFNQQKGLDIKAQNTYQERKNVRKDLYVIDKETRKHYVISSDLSKIFINKKNQNYELIENLDKITFLCFENIDPITKLQHIKYITSLKGFYFFPSHCLELKDINLSFINANKQTNIDFNNAYFTGHAKELKFSIQNKKPIIEIFAFDGLFDPKKGYKCEK